MMNLNFMNRWKLTKKFVVSILIALALVFFVMTAVINLHEKRVLMKELASRGESLSNFLAEISAEPILSYNFNYLENYAQFVTKQDKDVAYVVILDKQGSPLTHQLQEPTQKAGLIEFTSPVLQGSDPIGKVKMLLSTAHIDQERRKSQFIIIALSLGTMAIISLIVVVLFRSIVTTT
ncbi:MAG TPA: hypothetical protein VIX18_01325, partial [Nitrospirota bacterium]